ncbi:MAG: NUMOD4 domain-containing protein, partial [Fulvivirga sp.]|nr:NUMOD4 domain-containing protein [Fulvivirga sp.]
MGKRPKERWKKLKFPEGFNTQSNYQISNYGRVRNVLKDGSMHIKKKIISQGNVRYKFSFPQSLNDGLRKVLHQKGSRLVARHFCKDYHKGCYVIHKDYNRFNNYYTNLLCMDESNGKSYLAKGRKLSIKQEHVLPPKDHEHETADMHKVEMDHNFYKVVPGFPNYEINRFG